MSTKTRSSETDNGKLLFTSADWDFETLKATYDAIEDIAMNELKLDVYPNQVEVITSEQMLDAYSSIGMPLMYHHWSFGKRFVRDDVMYRKGYQGLAYEIVINSNPCISYVMEENTIVMQALVMAHAAFGHNHFFKNNYLFKQWTDAEGILDYLQFAKGYIAKCEDRYGFDAVERVLDAAHALMEQGLTVIPIRKNPILRSNWNVNANGPNTKTKPITICGAPCPSLIRAIRIWTSSNAKCGSRNAAPNSAFRKKTCFISWKKMHRRFRHGNVKSCGSCAISVSISIPRNRPK